MRETPRSDIQLSALRIERIMRSLFSLRPRLSDSVFGASPPSLSVGLPSLTQLSQNNLQEDLFNHPRAVEHPSLESVGLHHWQFRESVKRAFSPVPSDRIRVQRGSGSCFRSVARIVRPLRIISSQLGIVRRRILPQ
ncbi:hypothetical protein Q8A73_007139 [Channa argus]|nr:hypothetical protein Q8A73_007139 [Channa argus]